MHMVTSRDGTKIAYTREGSGPSVVLVGGALDDGSENATLIPALAERFTVINYAAAVAMGAVTGRRTRCPARSKTSRPLSARQAGPRISSEHRREGRWPSRPRPPESALSASLCTTFPTASRRRQ